MPALLPGEIIVDSFAGGGGASLGIERALGRSPDIAINHDREALAMHAVNHPTTRHLPHNVWKVDPVAVTCGAPVGLLWASPDCKHHSKAKGGKPVRREIRDLAWVVVRWAKQVRPRIIMLENVEEFRDWGPLGADDRPCPDRKGKTFDLFVAELRRLGYRVEHRELRACDYGAPTIRKRLFLVARRDGAPIAWPAPTHGAPTNPLVLACRLKPWRTAAEIIDWSLPCRSIFLTREEGRAFGVNRPLADNTMARIAKGVKRYVLDAVSPFIVPVTHAGDARVHGADEPLRTVTTAHRGEHALVTPFVARTDMHKSNASCVYPGDDPLRTITTGGGHAVVAPFVTKFRTGATGQSVDDPLATVTANSFVDRPGGAAPLGVVSPYLVPRYGERPGQEPRTRSIKEPVPVVVPTANGGGLAAVHLSRQFGDSVGSGVKEPIGTTTAGGGGKTALVAAFLAQHNGDRSPKPGRSADEPLSTVVGTGGQQNVISAFLAQNNYLEPGHDVREPMSTIVAKGCTQAVVEASFLSHSYTSNTCGGNGDMRSPKKTITAGGTHAAEVRAFLVKYYGEAIGQLVDDPLHTATAKPRFGLVTVDIAGEPYVIVDIGMRMLAPRELFRAQGFGDDFVIDRGRDLDTGVELLLTKTAQVRMCGNSVCPDVAEALVRTNVAAKPVTRRVKPLRDAPLLVAAE